jgi:RND family efflux transporter MFP subunit
MASKTNLFTKIKDIPSLFRDRKKRWWTILTMIVLLAGVGGGIYYRNITSTQQTSQSTLQTTVARRGDIILSASGTGTLIPATEIKLGFGTSGKITKLDVKVGDLVEKGQLIAELDNTSQEIQYEQAKRSVAELTSVAAIAQAQQDVASAITSVSDAKNLLIYLISPDVFFWEGKVAEAQQALNQAKTEAGSSPTTDQQKKISDTETGLKNAQAKLASSQYRYLNGYIPANFTVTQKDRFTRTTTIYVAAPTDAEIAAARASYTLAQATLQEAQWYLDALNGMDIPENATGTNLTTLETARINLRTAEDTLNGTKIYAPISGTIMSVDAQLGDTVSTSSIMVVADLNKLYIQTYVDESDYDKFKVGNEVQIIFDALPDQTFKGKVVQVDPELNTSSGSSVVSGLVELEPTSADLLMGMGASVEVVAGQTQNAVLVSIDALHEYDPGKYAVFVMQQNGKLAVRNVEIGLKDLVNAEVKSGLQAGDVVSTGITETKQ